MQASVHLVPTPWSPCNCRLRSIPSTASFKILCRLLSLVLNPSMASSHTSTRWPRLSLPYRRHSRKRQSRSSLRTPCTLPCTMLASRPPRSLSPPTQIDVQFITARHPLPIPHLPLSCHRRRSCPSDEAYPRPPNILPSRCQLNNLPRRPSLASLRTSYTRRHIATTTSRTATRPTRAHKSPALAAAQTITARPLLRILPHPLSRPHRRPPSSWHPSEGTHLRAPRRQSQPRPGSVPTAHTSSVTVVHPTSGDTSRRTRTARMLRTGYAAGYPC